MFVRILYELKECVFSLTWFILNILPEREIFNKLRGRFLVLFLKSGGNNLQVSKNVHILSPKNMVVGNNVFIGYSTWINAYGGLIVHDDVMFGPFCCVSTANHTNEGNGYRWGKHSCAEVEIQDGVWLAAHVIVLPGTKVHQGSLLAAGSIVNRELETGLYCAQLAKRKR